jgi:hypothetical protein
MQTLVLAVQNAVPASEVGVATASATFFRQIGGSLGVAVFLSILFNQLADTIPAAFKNKDVQNGIKEALTDPAVIKDPNNADFIASLQGGDMASLADKLNTDSSFLNHLDPRLARPFLIGFSEAGVTVFWAAGLVVAISVILAIFIKAPKLRDKSAMQEAAQSAAH